jgi:hypothetical protein
MAQGLLIRRPPSGPKLLTTEEPVLPQTPQFVEDYNNALESHWVIRVGRNAEVDSGQSEDVWTGGGDYTGFLQAAESLRIRAGGHVNDDAAGSGARAIYLEGLDGDYNNVVAVIPTAGAAQSDATVSKFRRLRTAIVLNSGTYGGTNAGGVTVETVSGTVMGVIEAEKSTGHLSQFTVPRGHVFWLHEISVSANSANQLAEMSMKLRENSHIVAPPYSSTQTLFTIDGVVGQANFHADFNARFEQYADMWFRVKAGSNNTEASALYSGLLLKLEE